MTIAHSTLTGAELHDPKAHASGHLTSGADEVDGDKLDIDYTPSNYTPSTTPAEADSVDNLTAHLYGIDIALGSAGGSTSVAVIADQKTQGTAGGSFNSGAWQTRDLNTEVSDPSGLVTITSNRFTPVSGTYLIVAMAPAYTVQRHIAKLYNYTQSTDTLFGSSEYSGSSLSSSTIMGIFTANGSDEYEIRHYCGSSHATNGYGVESNFAVEKYTLITLIKIG